MKKAKRFISLLIALIFVFPIIYQGVHVVQNHWQSHKVSHCCCHDHSEPDGPQYKSPTDKVKTCLVCDFEFASFHKNEKIKLSSKGNFYVDITPAQTQKAYSNNHIQVTTLRGPPSDFFV